MGVRKIVKIDEDLCNGCAECVPACAEGAIEIVEGKAVLVADNLCDGLGACLGDCPEGAISIEERSADDFDEQAVASTQQGNEPLAVKPTTTHQGVHAGGCPSARVLDFPAPEAAQRTAQPTGDQVAPATSALGQWPVQLHLVPAGAPFLEGADLLLAADCTAFALGDFHQNHLPGKSLVIACPKLDNASDVYREKLLAMIDQGKINTLTVMVMEVPCCSGLVSLAQQAAARASRKVPIKYISVSVRGQLLEERWI